MIHILSILFLVSLGLFFPAFSVEEIYSLDEIEQPKSNEVKEVAKIEYNKLMNRIADVYKYLQEIGVPNEDARYVLPNACETAIEVKMNFRTLIHFMNERLCTRAQWEIRQMALLMKKAIEEQYPELAKYLVPKCEIHEGMPFCTEHGTCKRHPQLKNIYEDYVELQTLIDESKNGDITDVELAQKFWDIFVKPKGYTGKF